MKLKTKLTALAVASTLMGSTAAMATTITTSTGTYANFGGFDWASNGLAVVNNYTLTTTGQSVSTTLDYWASAATVVDPSQAILVGPTLGLLSTPPAYEYTIIANVNETATCTGSSAGFCTSASFVINAGTWSIFYDTTPDANRTASTGYTDGIKILGGLFNTGPGGTFSALSPTSGSGSFALLGTVNFTDTTYINPALTNTIAGSELKIGLVRTDDGFLPTVDGTNGSAISPACSTTGVGTICMQADANQTFSRVPEPGTLMLLGLGLFGLGAVRVRRKI